MFKKDKPSQALQNCSIQIDAPRQEQRAESFGLLVGAWFDVLHDSFETDRLLQCGFRAAKVTVTCCDASEIAIQGRQERIAYREAVTTAAADTTTKGAGIEAEIGGETPKIFKLFSARAKANGELRRSVEEEQNTKGDYERVYRSLWSAGADYWRMAGLSLDDERMILTRNAIAEEPLCRIEETDDETEVSVSISIQLKDLWVGLDEAPVALPGEDANRIAVCKAVFARGLNTKGQRRKNAESGETEIVLAEATLRRVESRKKPDDD